MPKQFNQPLAPCKCGSAAVFTGVLKPFTVKCTNPACPAIVASQTKLGAATAWNDMATRIN